MLKLRQAVIVEGKYDKIKLEAILDAVIITTGGFGIYKDREKLALIKAFALKDGVIILTDSDSAGFQIRNHLKNVLKNGKIWHVYIPDIYGKEKRKEKASGEGKLGVEGVGAGVIRAAFQRAGITGEDEMPESKSRAEKTAKIREKLFDRGFIGREGAAAKKKKLLKHFLLPENLSTNAMIEVLVSLYTERECEEAFDLCNEMTEKN